jgi:hypothetical protein
MIRQRKADKSSGLAHLIIPPKKPPELLAGDIIRLLTSCLSDPYFKTGQFYSATLNPSQINIFI